jgi:hypothetical protein
MVFVEYEHSPIEMLGAKTPGKETVAGARWLGCAKVVLLDESTLEGFCELSDKRFLIRFCQNLDVSLFPEPGAPGADRDRWPCV